MDRSGTNFLTTMLRLGAEREELAIVDDQSGCPTSSADIATTILTMAAQAERPGFANWGTYHYVGADVVTWYGFAGMIFAGAARFGRKAPRLRPIATADYPTAASRPAYSVLGTAKLKRVFGVTATAFARQSRRSVSNGCSAWSGRARREGHHPGRRLRIAALSHPRSPPASS